MIGNDPALEVRFLEAFDRVIEMKLEGPLSDLGNLGVVDLDLIGHEMPRLAGGIAIIISPAANRLSPPAAVSVPAAANRVENASPSNVKADVSWYRPTIGTENARGEVIDCRRKEGSHGCTTATWPGISARRRFAASSPVTSLSTATAGI